MTRISSFKADLGNQQSISQHRVVYTERLANRPEGPASGARRMKQSRRWSAVGAPQDIDGVVALQGSCSLQLPRIVECAVQGVEKMGVDRNQGGVSWWRACQPIPRLDFALH